MLFFNTHSYNISKIIHFKIILINLLFFIPLKEINYLRLEANTNKPDTEYLKAIPKSNFYIIGPGDTLYLEVNESTSELNLRFSIDGEGTAKLPRLDRIYVSGLSIGELSDILNKEYSKFVNEPNVKIDVIEYRPVKIYIKGEVDEPGLHILPGSSSIVPNIENFDLSSDTNNSLANNINDSINIKRNQYFPSIYDALRKSGGITVYADLENLELTRINNLTNGGGRIKTNINLLSALTLKDVSQNIRILDGDTIKINRLEKPFKEQLSEALKANINPKFIKIAIAGQIENPGTVKVNKSSTLNEAITFSGGTKALKGPIIFTRYENNGNIDRRKFRYSSSANPGSYKNPYLSNGDIIVVSKSGLKKTNEVISEITSPLQGIFSSYGFYKLLTD